MFLVDVDYVALEVVDDYHVRRFVEQHLEPFPVSLSLALASLLSVTSWIVPQISEVEPASISPTDRDSALARTQRVSPSSVTIRTTTSYGSPSSIALRSLPDRRPILRVPPRGRGETPTRRRPIGRTVRTRDRSTTATPTRCRTAKRRRRRLPGASRTGVIAVRLHRVATSSLGCVSCFSDRRRSVDRRDSRRRPVIRVARTISAGTLVTVRVSLVAVAVNVQPSDDQPSS